MQFCQAARLILDALTSAYSRAGLDVCSYRHTRVCSSRPLEQGVWRAALRVLHPALSAMACRAHRARQPDQAAADSGPAGHPQMASAPLKRPPSGGPLYSAPAAASRFSLSLLPVEAFSLRCRHADGLVLRVTARIGSGPEVISERPVAPGAATSPRSLGVNPLEAFAMWVDAPAVLRAGVWAALAGSMLLIAVLPRALWAAGYAASSANGGAGAAAPSGFDRHGAQQEPTTAGSAAGGGGAAGAIQRRRAREGGGPSFPARVRGAAAAAAAALAAFGGRVGAWRIAAQYLGFLALGPWLVGTVLTGHAPGAFFASAALVRAPGTQRWEYTRAMDVVMITLPHLLVSILPLFLWVACALHVVGEPSAAAGGAGATLRAAARARPAQCGGATAVLVFLSSWAINTVRLRRRSCVNGRCSQPTHTSTVVGSCSVRNGHAWQCRAASCAGALNPTP